MGVHTFQIPTAELVIVTCAFLNASLDINVAFNEAQEIVGLTITPVGSVEQPFTVEYEPPAYWIKICLRNKRFRLTWLRIWAPEKAFDLSSQN